MDDTKVLTRKTKILIEARIKRALICERCNEEIHTGDRYISKSRQRGTKHYHEKCWEEMFISGD